MPIKLRWSGSSQHPHYMTGGRGNPYVARDTRTLLNTDQDVCIASARKALRGINMLYAGYAHFNNPFYGGGYSWGTRTSPARRVSATAAGMTTTADSTRRTGSTTSGVTAWTAPACGARPPGRRATSSAAIASATCMAAAILFQAGLTWACGSARSDDELGLLACDFVLARAAELLDGTTETELRHWLIDRDPAIAEMIARLDAGWKLPKTGEFTVDPSNAPAEARIIRHLLRERIEQCAGRPAHELAMAAAGPILAPVWTTGVPGAGGADATIASSPSDAASSSACPDGTTGARPVTRACGEARFHAASPGGASSGCCRNKDGSAD